MLVQTEKSKTLPWLSNRMADASGMLDCCGIRRVHCGMSPAVLALRGDCGLCLPDLNVCACLPVLYILCFLLQRAAGLGRPCELHCTPLHAFTLRTCAHWPTIPPTRPSHPFLGLCDCKIKPSVHLACPATEHTNNARLAGCMGTSATRGGAIARGMKAGCTGHGP